MAIIEGFVTGIIRDAETGKVKRTFSEQNHVTEWMLDELTTNTSIQKFGPYIYVTDLPYATDARQQTIFGSVQDLAVGFTVTSVVGVQGTVTPKFPHYIQFHQRFNPPSTDRTIKAVGLTHDSTVSYGSFVSPCHAGVGLSATCTQTTTETLDVFYRVQFPWEYDWVNDDGPALTDYGNTWWQAWLVYALSKNSPDSSDWPNGVQVGYGNVNPRSIAKSFSPSTNGGATPPHDFHTGSFVSSSDTTYSKNILTSSADIADTQGQIIQYFRYGDAGSGSEYHAAAVPEGATPIQNVFSHGAAADKPFFDSGNLPTGDATVAFGGDTWTNPNFAKMYRVNITTSGAVGVGEYQLWVRNTTGFHGNTYQNMLRLIQTGYSDSFNRNSAFDGFNIQYDGNSIENEWGPRFVAYGEVSPGHCLAIRTDEFSFWNVAYESSIRFNSTNYPAFVPTDIGDYAIDSTGDIFISCRNTGLYKIADPLGSPVITLIDDTTTGLTGAAGPQVYGLAAGRNDRMWVLMDGGLFYSDNSGTSWSTATFSFTGISDANWSKVIGLQADIEHADDRLALIYGTVGQPNNDYVICWYDLSSTTTVLGPYVTQSSSGSNHYDSFKVGSDKKYSLIDYMIPSRSQSKWGTVCRRTSSGSTYGNPAYFTFGTTTVTTSGESIRNAMAQTFVTDDEGNQSLMCTRYTGLQAFIYKITDVEQTWLFSDSTTNWDLLGLGAEGGTNQGGAHCHLGGGMYLSNHLYYLKSISNLTSKDDGALGGACENVIWKKYGWTGAAWVEGDSGSKVTHLSEDAAIDGLTIQFDDDSGAESYFATDYYTVGVLNGIWMDGSTEYEHASSIYYKPIQDQTELEISVIPGTTQSVGNLPSKNFDAHSWQDVTSNISTTTDYIRLTSTYLTNDYSRGGRTVTTIGGALPDKPNLDNVQIQLNARLYTTTQSWIGVNAAQMIFGLSDSSFAGNAIDGQAVQYGFLVDGRADPTDNIVTISVIESGVVKYTVPGGFYAPNIDEGTGFMVFVIQLLDDGTLNYMIGNNATIYTSTANATGVYLVDVGMHGQQSDAGIEDITTYDASTTGRLFELGTSGSPATGRYVSEYQQTDTSQSTFLIDGTPATLINDNTLATVPAAGEIVVARSHGFFKVSDSDVGKSISADYVIVTKE